MSNTNQNPIPAPEGNGEAQKLTINDPISPDVLQRLSSLSDAKGQVALRLLELEQEKINCLGAAKRLGDENERLFTSILMERGLAPGTVVNIDGRTGKLSVAGQDAPPAESPPAPPAAPAGPTNEAGTEAPAR